VERTGVLVDLDYYLALEQEILSYMASLEKKIYSVIGGRIMAKHKNNTNPLKARLLIDYMFSPLGLNLKPLQLTPKSNEPVVGLDHLMMFRNNPKAKPFVDLLVDYSSASKALSTYVVGRSKEGVINGGFLSHLRSDGRFHPTYFFFNNDEGGGTITGRLSARDPAFQTLPKHTKWAKKLRRAIVAPPGYVILSHDYSQGELRIAACLADETRMIDAYKHGLDLHAVTGSSVAGLTWAQFLKLQEHDPEQAAEVRQGGKAGNFGLIYGMSPGGYQNYAAGYGLDLTLSSAEEVWDKFFATYPALRSWHKKYISIAHKNKAVRSPLGRVRHLPHIDSRDNAIRSKSERQAINSPVQGTLSDLSLWATAEFNKRGWLHDAPVIGMVHDQLLSYVPEDRIDEVEQRNREVMENLPFEIIGWKPQLTFSVDAEIGQNLAEMKKRK